MEKKEGANVSSVLRRCQNDKKYSSEQRHDRVRRTRGIKKIFERWLDELGRWWRCWWWDRKGSPK